MVVAKTERCEDSTCHRDDPDLMTGFNNVPTITLIYSLMLLHCFGRHVKPIVPMIIGKEN